MEIITVCSRKGGAGKTATAQALGAGLVKEGYSVLYIDLDSQQNLSYALGADMEARNIMSVLLGKCKATDAIQTTEQGADIIPASEILSSADMALNDTGKEYKLKEALEGLKYDYCIIDTPAALGTLTINALTASKSCVIPIQAEAFSLQGLQLVYGTISNVKKYCNPRLKIKGILITRYSGRAILSRDMRENIEDEARRMKTKVFDTAIRENIAIKEAQALQTDIFSYAPKSNGAQDYQQFVQEFLGK